MMSGYDSNEITMGSPTLEEIKSYYLNQGWSDSSPAGDTYCSTSSDQDSSIDLDESFKKLLESRRKKCEARQTLIKTAISNNAFNSPLSANDTAEMNTNTKFSDLRTPLRGTNTSLWKVFDTTTVEEEEDWRKVSEDSFAANEQFCDSLSPATSKHSNEDFSVDSLNVDRKTKLIDLTTDDETAMDSDELEARALEYSSTYEPTTLILAENSAMNRLLKELDANDQQTGEQQPKSSQLMLPVFMADETQLNDIEAPSAIWENTMFSNSPRPSPMKMVGMMRPSTILEEDTMANFTVEISRRESIESYKTAYVDGKENKFDDTVASTKSSVETADFHTADEQQEHSCASTDSPTKESPTMYEVIEITDQSIGDENMQNRFNIERHSEKPNNETCHTSYSDEVSARETSSVASASSRSEYYNSLEDDALDNTRPPRLNDTLEEVEFMMEQGRKLLEAERNKKIKESATLSALTPITLNKALGTRTYYNSPNTPNSVIKQRNINSPKSSAAKPGQQGSSLKKVDSFKRPVISSRIPQASRTTPHNQLKFNKYDHIVSPIGMYIKHTPQVTLDVRHKGGSSLSAQMHNKSIRDSEQSFKENMVDDMRNYKPTIPRKGITSSAARHILDERIPTKICGGNQMKQLLGPSARSPTVIRHEGRLKMNYPRRQDDIVNDTMDDSLVNMSMMSGDVSVQVVKNVNRY